MVLFLCREHWEARGESSPSPRSLLRILAAAVGNMERDGTVPSSGLTAHNFTVYKLSEVSQCSPAGKLKQEGWPHPKDDSACP